MTFQVDWYIERCVVRSRFYGNVTVQEIIQNTKCIEAYLATGIQPLFLFIDLRDVTKFPADFEVILSQLSSLLIEQSAIAWTLILSDNRLYNFFSVLEARIIQVPSQSFKTEGDADLFIAHYIPDLAPLLFARHLAPSTTLY